MVGEYGPRRIGIYVPFVLLTLYSILILTHQEQTAFENIVGKEEIALFAAELEEPKIGM